MTNFEISLDRLKEVEPQDNWTEADWTHFKTIKLALEKQIPKKPNKIKLAPSNSYITYGSCPCCNEDVYEYQHHCEDCGQALDWSDYRKEDKNDR